MKTSFRLCLFALLLALPAWAQQAPQDNWTLDFAFTGAGNGGALNYPAGMAVAADGKIVVGDTYNHRVQVFNPNGTFLRKFGTEGSGNGQFSSPQGVAVTPDGNIVVADSSNNRVQVFTMEGVFIRAFGGLGSGNGQMSYPMDVAVFPDGTIAVADTGNDRIQVFSASGAFVRKWSTFGTGSIHNSTISSIAIDAAGTVFAADRESYKVRVFTSDGSIVREWGSFGSDNGQFNGPGAIDVTPGGEVLVAERGGHRVQVFNAQGGFLRKWGTQGTAPGQLNYPAAIAALADGQIAVLESESSRIQIFDSTGTHVAIVGRYGRLDEGFAQSIFNIDVDSEGKIYVAQGYNYPEIQVFTPSGQPLEQPSINHTPQPFTLKLGPDDKLYLSSSQGVEVRERTGALVRKLGSGTAGSGNGQFGYNGEANYVAFDTNGDIYATDTGNSRIQVFNANGQFLRKFGEPGTGPGQLSYPSGIALTPDGRVAVGRGYAISYFTKAGQFIEQVSTTTNGWLLSIGPDGLAYHFSDERSGPVTGDDLRVAGVNHRTGAVYLFDETNRRVQAWRRGFRTLGAASPRLVPMPGIRTVAQRPNGYIDIDYSVTDGDSATVATALAAFKGGSTLLREMVLLPSAALVEGTATKVGPAMATGTVHRVTWNPAGSGLASGDLVFEVFARDDRPKLLDMDFITLPTAQPLTISRIPFTHADLRAAWAWLILNGEPGLSRAGDGEIVGPGGTFTSSSGAETQTTAAGRAWLFAKLGVREATSQEVTTARQATSTTTPNRFTPVRGQRMGDRPRAANEWTFDSSDQYGSEAWWVVPTP